MKINKIKIWTAVNRDGNRRNKESNVKFEISINSHNNDIIIICTKLLDKVKKDYIIDIIATDVKIIVIIK